MVEIIWTPEALDHVDDIISFVSKDSVDVASRVVSRIFDTADRLATFPEIGAFVPELMSKRFREIHVFKYRIIYRFRKKTNEIHVLAVVHAARSLSKQFFRRLT